MRQFFHGWQWKLGCVTLLIDLVFTGMWVRSLTVEDVVKISTANGIRFFILGSERISWGTFESAHFNAPGTTSKPWTWMSRPNSSNSAFRELESLCELEWEWNWFGLYSAERRGRSVNLPTHNDRLRYDVVSIWFIVIPLTLISIWLLLVKPRNTTQTKITEPTANEGTT